MASIPYMGSKRKSAGKIYQAIKNQNPNADTICDLFCGGFAISDYFLKNGWNIIANDKNKHVVALIDQTINKGLDEKKCLEFVTREMFYDVTNNPDNYEDWYIGYVQCLWSFGNTQTNYLFGKETEPYKNAGHQLIVNLNPEPIKKLLPKIPQIYIDGILKQDSWQKRRIALMKVIKALKTRIFEMQQLERVEKLQQLEHLQRLEMLEQIEKLQQLQQLQGLERLERLEKLQSLQNLQTLESINLTSLSYDEVDIPANAVIYCDPPYKGTAEYKEGNFNHAKFWEWVREKSKTHNVYVSEYQAPEDFEVILSFEQKSSLQGGSQSHDNQPKECLFRIKKN